jgi:signal transduction histidine kinase
MLLVTFTTILLVILGILSIITLKKDRIAWVTFFITVMYAVWTISNYLYPRLTDYDPALFYSKLIFSSTSFMFFGMVVLALYYPQKLKSRFTNAICAIVFIIAAIVAVISQCTDTVILSLTFQEDIHQYIFDFNRPNFLIYVAFAVLSLSFAIAVLFYKYNGSRGRERLQLRYLFLGYLVAAITGSTTNMLFPMAFGIFQYSDLGTLLGTFYLIAVIYSITIRRLHDIQTLATNLFFIMVRYLATYIVIIGGMGLWYWLTEKKLILLSNEVLISAVVAAVFVEFIRNLLDQTYTRFQRTNAKKLATLESKISTELDIKNLSDLVVNYVKESVGIEECAVVIIDQEKGDETYHSIYHHGDFEAFPMTITGDITKIAKKEMSTIVVVDELEKKAESGVLPIHEGHLREILSQIHTHNIHAMILLTHKEKYQGIILLGEKDDTLPFTVEDIRLLEGISRITSIAISRALLYEEVQNFNITLQEKVDKATKELKVRNKELQDLYDSLEEIYQKEKDLMDIAGHEFRTPASILKNNLYLLKKRLKEVCPANADEKLQVYLDRLIEGTDRQIKLVNTFLESARIDNQRFEIQVDVEDMQDIVGDTVEDVKQFAKQKDLQVIYHHPNKKIFAEIDHVRLREVIDNLLNNAVKYTESGYIEVTLTDKNDTILFSVKDTGIGIKEEDQVHLFKKFSRVENYIGGEDGAIVRPGGTGLGLYVSRTIIEAHGGKIRLESEQGKGSTFSFEIPKKQPSYIKRVEGSKGKLESKSLGI